MKTAFSRIVFLLMLILTVASMLYANSQKARADRMEQEAIKSKILAERNAEEAEKQRDAAVQAMADAFQQRKLAEEKARNCK